MRWAICNEVFQGWDLEAAMKFAAATGYHGIELAPFTLAALVTDLSQSQRVAVSAMARRHGLEICGLHWLLARTEGFHLTSPDSEVRRRTAKYLVDLTDACADLGGKTLVLGSPQQRSFAPGVSSEQASEWAASALSDAVRRAEDRGVIWCIEPLGAQETNFINTASGAIAFARRLDSPAARIVLDVKAMSAESVSIEEIIRQSWPQFAHFHANDPNLKGPGFGAVDFRPIAAALRAVGYAGFISVEVLNFAEGPEMIAVNSLRYLRESFGECLTEACDETSR